MAHVEIYLSRLCIYCWQARRILDELGVSYQIKGVPMVLGWKLPTRAYREMVARAGGCNTVPQIFVDGVHLGDEDTLQALANEGALRRALKLDA